MIGAKPTVLAEQATPVRFARRTAGKAQGEGRVAARGGEDVLEYRVAEEQEGGRVIVELRGELQGERWTERMLGFLEEHYVQDGVRVIALDLSHVDTIDLEGVSVLVRLAQESARRGKAFVVLGAAGSVRAKLEMTGMLPYLEGH
jgi:anti-anti-sigma factor